MASINIPAMRSLLTCIKTAGGDFRPKETDLRGHLTGVGLAGGAEAPIGVTAQWCDDQVAPLVRRLSLAEMVEAQKVGLQDTVSIDESQISSLTPAEAQAKADELAAALNSGKQLTDEQWKALVANANDPYFSVALANQVPPERLASVAQGLSLGHEQDLANVYPQDGEDYEQARQRVVQDYESRLQALGIMLGTASRSEDPRLAPGYAQQVVDLMTSSDGQTTQGTGLPVAMSVVLSYGTYSKDFATTVAQGVYDFERSENFTTWRSVAGQHGQFVLPGGARRTDVMAGVMTMLSSNADASQEFFSGGPTTTIDVHGQQVTVTERMKYLIQDRVWGYGDGSDEADGLGAALEAATTTYRNREDSGQRSAELATQAFVLIGSKTGEGYQKGGFLNIGARDGWHMYTGMRDNVANMVSDYAPDLFRVAGNPPVADKLAGGYSSGDDQFPPGMPYGALMDKELMGRLLGTLGQDPEHIATVGAGWAAANNVLINHQLQKAIAEDDQAAVAYLLGQLAGPDNHAASGATVLRFITDSAFAGEEDQQKRDAAKAKAMQDILSLAGSVPVLKPAEMLGEWGGWAFNQAKSEAIKQVGTLGGGSADTAQIENYRNTAADQAQQMYMDALLTNGYFDQAAIDGANKTPGVNLKPPPASIVITNPDGTRRFDTDHPDYASWAKDNSRVSEIQQAIIAAFELPPR